MTQPAPAVRTEVVHPSWLPVLDRVAPALRDVGAHLAAEAAAGHAVLPAPDRVLRALATPLDDVRVVIVGQDPYPTPGHPVGLAFAVDRAVTVLPGSLRNIYRELHADTGMPVPGHGDLSAWTGRGVLLLNRVLTVRAGAPGSHRQRGWEQVTDAVLRALVHRGGPLVAVLWGRQAQTLRPALGDVPVVTGAHPSPLSASRGFLGSRPFSCVDELLTAQGADPVDWSLPR
ncbi:uracil-DNA glycosylase [Kineosporiaceae bacterium SCSIO 59966]|nr:uracil-DNA glycosylase [Kineosporiaceae bacterium SCSIO 59966]